MLAPRLARLKPVVQRALPAPVWAWLREVAGRAPAPAPPPTAAGPAANIYETLYEAHGKQFSDEDVVGAGSFDLIGRIELGILLMEGLRPTDTLLDFGCGTGRLAVHCIPRLAGGHYIGVDISQAMLDKAQARIGAPIPEPPCRVSWVKQTTTEFPFTEGSIDLICAFSVFTHIEHEDSYRYLTDALRVIRPGGRFIFSCLPMSTSLARDVFLASARDDFQARWSKVRNVTTSVDLMTDLARLAGWIPLRWYAGEERNVRLPDTGELAALGQSTCVLEAPGPGRPAASTARAEVVGAAAPGDRGRVDLFWDAGSPPLAPHFTGPLEGKGGRFHLLPSADAATAGSLAAPPFARLDHDPDRRRSVVRVSRVTTGSYRYSVAARGGGEDGLARSGATVHVFYGDNPAPTVFRPPRGAGARWTVFDASVDGGSVWLRPVNALGAAVDEADTEAWSPAAPGGADPALDPDQRCPQCRSLTPARETPAATVMRKHVYEYRRCGECGILYAVPRPSPPELLRRLSHWAQAAPRLGAAEQEAAIRAVEHRFQWIRRHHPAARTLLDIGAGAGAFLAAARGAGLEARGVELVPDSARFPGVEIMVGDVRTLDLPPRSYDVVTLWDTIEHLVDPLGTVRRALELLRDEGLLMIETPNEKGLSARLRGAGWWVFGPTDHLVMFSPATLHGLVRRAGGRLVHAETRELCSWNDPGNARPLPWPGRLLERARAMRGTRAALRTLGLGDWVFAIARPEPGQSH